MHFCLTISLPYAKMYIVMRNKEVISHDVCNWIVRNLLIKKKMLKEAGVDITSDNERKVNKAFKDAADFPKVK